MIMLRKFLRHGTRVASVAPSSPQMAKEMCRHVDSATPQVIVELGAGTGAVTRQIVEKMHPNSRLIAVEIDHDFAERLKRKVDVSRAEILVADVNHLPQHLERLGIGRVDVVISGLPMPSLPAATVAAVQDFITAYAASAWYSQLTEFPWAVYRRFYERLFGHVEYKIVPINFPPGGVYHCR